MEQLLDELHVNCLPTDIPAHIDVDISKLDLGDHIRAGDLRLDENVEILADLDTLICTCVQPHVHKLSAAEEAAEAAAEATAAEAKTEGAASA